VGFITNILLSAKKICLVWSVPLVVFHLLYKQVYFLYSDLSEHKRIGEEVVMVYSEVLPSHSLGVTEGNHRNPVRVVCATVKIQTGHHPHRVQNCYH
jgi:hypothetical protein